MKASIFTVLFLTIIFNIGAQIVVDNEVKYGNEWIDFEKQYFKIPIAEDAIYRITYQELINANININQISGRDFQLFVYGEEIPIYTSTNGNFDVTDYIEFYGEKNRSQLDYYLFRDKNHLLNPEYSIFTDTVSFFLTWDNTTINERYTTLENDLSAALPSAEQYYIHEEKLVNNSEFVKPLRDELNHVYKSNFDVGEGFGSKLQKTNSFTLNTSNVFNNGELPELKLRLATNIGNHNINVKLNNLFRTQINESGFVCKDYEIPVEINDLTSEVNISLEGTNDGDYTDKNSVSYISLKYSRELTFSNTDFFKFQINNSQSSKYFEIRDFDISGNNFVLYDIENNIRLIPEIDNENNLVKFLLPPSTINRELVLVNVDKSVKSINKLQKTEFYNYLEIADKNYIILSNKEKFYDNNQTNWVEEYANYRSASIGGNFNTLIVDVNDLYNQFGYGINRHSQGINNFLIYLKDQFINPEYIFIIGKGLEYNEIRTEEQLSDPNNIFHVPTFGYPGSDNLLASRHEFDYPEIPIGRLAAKSHEQIQTYLNKVISHEQYDQYGQTLEDKAWMKKIIHLAGGDPSIALQIDYSLQSMGNIIENNAFGGIVKTYDRHSSDANQSVTEKIVNEINDGAGIITFFGHSGVTGTDFNIAISNLQNDKYPVFYSLGCYSGNIHTPILSGQSESFVLNDKGVIAYIGTSGAGFTGNLYNLGKKIYSNSGSDYYGEGIGKMVQSVIKSIAETTYDFGSVTLNQQFTFHGDPAITYHTHNGPDYLIDETTVRTEPEIINASSNSFNLNFDIVNIGKGVNKSMNVKVIRSFPDGTTETINTNIQAPKSRKTISLNINTNGDQSLGENCISIILDDDNQIEELPVPHAENNNELNQNSGSSFCFNVVKIGVKQIYPKEFSIYTKQEVELLASTPNLFENSSQFIIQIDTTESFDSPVFEQTNVISEGGLISWKPQLNCQENTVYYWRISPNNNELNSYIWQYSSFIYLPNSSEGWNQSHYYQYLKDEFEGTEFKGRKLDFESKIYNVRLLGKKYDPNNPKIGFIDGETWGTANPTYRPSINILCWGPNYWFRNVTGHDFNSLQNPNLNSLNFNYIPSSQDHVQGIKQLLEEIPDSMTVYIYTVLGSESESLYPENWSQHTNELGYNFISILESYGAQKIHLMETRGTVPYVYIFKKGVGPLQEKIGESINDEFAVEQNVSINSSNGKFSSQAIGPAQTWDKFVWNVEDSQEQDEIHHITIYKLDQDLNKIVFAENITDGQEVDLSAIDPMNYPYIKLEFYASDFIKRDPPQINFWRVYYTGYPDAVLKNDNQSYFHNNTLNFGETFSFKTTVSNITNIDMDSLLVKYSIIKENNEEVVVYDKYAPLIANTSYPITFNYPTDNLSSSNEFIVEINPDLDQIEDNYLNNIGSKIFSISQDTRLGDYVWFDENGDGQQDNNEKCLDGVKVILFKVISNSSGSSDTIKVDSAYSHSITQGFDTIKCGFYTFTNIEQGEYFVEIENPDPNQYISSPKNTLFDENNDSDFTYDGRTEIFSLNSFESNLSVDAGFYKGGCLEGLIWRDRKEPYCIENPNNPGDSICTKEHLYDIYDYPLSEILVELYSESGELKKSIFTDENGIYRFNNIEEGMYYLVMNIPDSLTVVNYNFGNDESSDNDFFKDNNNKYRSYTFSVYANSYEICIDNIDGGAMLIENTQPVEMLNFETFWDKTTKSVNLEWQTLNEININHYKIEKKSGKDGRFEKYSTIEANNSLDLNSYIISDSNVEKGKRYYYSLYAIDFDGIINKSYIRTVLIPGEYFSIITYPNPVNKKLNLLINGNLLDNTIIEVLDITGKKIMKSIELEKSNESSKKVTIDMNSFSQGHYYIRVISSQNVETLKVLHIR